MLLVKRVLERVRVGFVALSGDARHRHVLLVIITLELLKLQFILLVLKVSLAVLVNSHEQAGDFVADILVQRR